MKPLLYTAALVCGLAAFWLFQRFWQLWQRDPSVRSMVANEQSQMRFLLGGLALLTAALLMLWWA